MRTGRRVLRLAGVGAASLLLLAASVGLLPEVGVLAEVGDPQQRWGDGALAVGFALVGWGLREASLVVGGWRQQRQRTRAIERANRSGGERSVRVGDLVVGQATLVATSRQREAVTDRFLLRFPVALDAPRPLPADVAAVGPRLLAALRQRARERRVPFYNEAAVDMVSWHPVGENDGSGRLEIDVGLAPTDYEAFATTSNALDEDLTTLGCDLPAPTLRQHWASRAPRGIEDVASLPAPAKVGVGVLVVTSEGALCLLERGPLYQAGEREGGGTALLHVVAEGMIPGDRAEDGRLSPTRTARRALAEELGADVDAQVRRLDMVGVVFDLQRWQPVFAYLAEVDASSDDLQRQLSSAAHRHESRGLVFFDQAVEGTELRRLLFDAHESCALASNHATMSVLLGLVYLHGFDRVDRSLTAP